MPLAAVLLLTASVIGSIVRIGQGRSFLRWGDVAVVSPILTFVFGGISDALYSDPLALFGNPGYRVVYSDPSSLGEVPTLMLSVLSHYKDEEGVISIAEGVVDPVDLSGAEVADVRAFDPGNSVGGGRDFSCAWSRELPKPIRSTWTCTAAPGSISRPSATRRSVQALCLKLI